MWTLTIYKHRSDKDNYTLVSSTEHSTKREALAAMYHGGAPLRITRVKHNYTIVVKP